MGSSDLNDMECSNNKYVQLVSTMSWLPCTFYPTTQGLFPARTRHHNYHNPSESEKVLRQLELHFFFFFCRNFQRNYFRLPPASQDFRNIDNTAFERPFRFMRHSCRAPASEPGSIMCFIFNLRPLFSTYPIIIFLMKNILNLSDCLCSNCILITLNLSQ